MSIEKKSLISKRSATKKAIVTKPEVSTVSPARKMTMPRRASGRTYRSTVTKLSLQ